MQDLIIVAEAGRALAADVRYSVSAFNQLAFSVEEISMHFFEDNVDDSVAIRREIQISGIPDITGHSDAARGLRCLVIQNQIFDVLQRRIFEPFLFPFNYDEYDSYGVDASLSIVQL